MAVPAHEVASLNLLGINLAAAASLSIFSPLTAQFDVLLTGSFGLGALQADISAQFNTALQLQLDLSLQLSDPIAGFQASLAAIGTLVASLQASISLGFPTVSADINASISANASLSAALGLKLGGISAIIEAGLAVKAPAIQLIGDLTASLSAGPVVLVSFGFTGAGVLDPDTLTNVGAQIQLLFSGGLTGIAPGDAVSGILLVTKAPTAAAAISVLFRVG